MTQKYKVSSTNSRVIHAYMLDATPLRQDRTRQDKTRQDKILPVEHAEHARYRVGRQGGLPERPFTRCRGGLRQVPGTRDVGLGTPSFGLGTPSLGFGTQCLSVEKYTTRKVQSKLQEQPNHYYHHSADLL